MRSSRAQEETGIRGNPVPLVTEAVEWAVYELVVDWGDEITVDGVEHHRFQWAWLDEALVRCLPALVSRQLRLGVR